MEYMFSTSIICSTAESWLDQTVVTAGLLNRSSISYTMDCNRSHLKLPNSQQSIWRNSSVRQAHIIRMCADCAGARTHFWPIITSVLTSRSWRLCIVTALPLAPNGSLQVTIARLRESNYKCCTQNISRQIHDIFP